MHCISQSFKRISQFLNEIPFQIHIHSFISFKLHYFQIHFPISISEKSVFSRISKSFSGFDFLRILSFQMTFQSISQVQIKIFQCFKILKFQNPKFSEIDFLRFSWEIFLRIHFPFQKSFSNEFLDFLRILKSIFSEKQFQISKSIFQSSSFPEKSLSNANFWFPMKFNDFPRNSNFQALFQSFSKHFNFPKQTSYFLKLALFSKFHSTSLILCAF